MNGIRTNKLNISPHNRYIIKFLKAIYYSEGNDIFIFRKKVKEFDTVNQLKQSILHNRSKPPHSYKEEATDEYSIRFVLPDDNLLPPEYYFYLRPIHLKLIENKIVALFKSYFDEYIALYENGLIKDAIYSFVDLYGIEYSKYYMLEKHYYRNRLKENKVKRKGRRGGMVYSYHG